MTALSTDAAALHRACLRDPADYTDRLLWADALTEAGDGELASFVRRDVALAQGDGREAGMAEDFADIVARAFQPVPALCAVRNQTAFCDGAYDAWRDAEPGNWYPIPAGTRAVLLVRAGMGAALRTTRGWFAAHAAEVFAAHPVTSVVLTDAVPRTRAFVAGEGDDRQAGWWRYDPMTHYPLAAKDLDPSLFGAAWALVKAVAGTCPFPIPIGARNWLWTRDAAAARLLLAAAAVNHGRALAALPALPPGPDLVEALADYWRTVWGSP